MNEDGQDYISRFIIIHYAMCDVTFLKQKKLYVLIVFHYLLNMKICPTLDLDAPGKSKLLVAVNHQCTVAYIFNRVNLTWQRTQTKFSCSWKHSTWCQQGAMGNSTASFQFISIDGKVKSIVVLATS